MNAGSAQLFVYYCVRASDAPDAIAAITAFQAQLRASMPGLVGSLSRRIDERVDLLTLMETYIRAGAASADWQRDIERQALAQLAPWIVGERHVEVFTPCA